MATTWQTAAGTVDGAVYTPPWVTVPHAEASWIDQVTATSELPVTVAVKVIVPPTGTVAAVGDTDTLTTGVADTVTEATACLLASAWLVAATWHRPAGGVIGAVYTPPWVTEPHPDSRTDQVTARSELPETVDVKVTVPPRGMVAVDGAMTMVTGGGVLVPGVSLQPARAERRADTTRAGQVLLRRGIDMLGPPFVLVALGSSQRDWAVGCTQLEKVVIQPGKGIPSAILPEFRCLPGRAPRGPG